MMAPAAVPEIPGGSRAFDLGRVHDLFPWSADHLRRGQPLEWLWSQRINASASEIWPLIADTSRLNRTLGLPRMTYEEIGGMLHGSTKYWGVPARWVEPPWSWEVNRNLFCVREYSRGFARVFRAGCFLEPQADGTTTVHMYFAWIPRGFLWRIFLRRMFPKMEPVYLRALMRLDRHLSDPARPGFHRVPRAEISEEAVRLLANARGKLAGMGVDADLAGRWVAYLEAGDPMDLHRIHLRILAHQWRIPERRVLESALIGVEAGLLQLHWDIVCPHCRGPRASLDSLEQLPPGLRCEACRVDFLTDGRGHIDVTFRPHPVLRRTEEVFYCAAEPARKEHYMTQRRLGPGERCSIGLDWLEGKYLASLNGQDRGVITLAAGRSPEDNGTGKWTASEAVGEITATAQGWFELVNDLDEFATFTIRQRDFPDDMIQLGDLLTIPAFGRLFGSQMLPMNAPLDLGSQTIVFASEGDGGEPAKEFLDRVSRVAAKFGGILVRTIGHSAVLLFNEPSQGVQAVHELLEGTGSQVRASVHSGECRVVRMQGGRDLIGRTVNIASRLLSAAGPGEALLSSAVCADGGAAGWLQSRGVELKIRQLDLDDLGVIEQARRMKPARSGGSAAP